VAVIAGPATDLRAPRARDFARLKLRVMGNTLSRQSAGRTVVFVVSVLFGLGLAGLGFLGFAASAAAKPELRAVLVTFVGTALVVGWALAPLLYFGVDETLDPARFALLPLPRRTLATGMLAAACVGIPAVATLLASLGLVVVGAVRGGIAGAAAGLVGAAVGLVLCVVLSRALTSAFAGALRSRRTRDLAAVVIALMASSIGPMQVAVVNVIENSGTGQAVRIAGILAWTPLAAPFAAVADATTGHWLAALVKFAIGLAAIALLLWWWSHTLESAMLGTASGGGGSKRGRLTGGVVRSLYPPALRAAPKTRFGAVLARESRYWLRDPRRRAGLISLVMAGIAVPLSLHYVGAKTAMSLPFAAMFAGVLTGTVLANQFGVDGTAYAVHLLTGVRGRVELLARVAGLGLIIVPLLVVFTVVMAVITVNLPLLPAALGTALAAFCVSASVASCVSVLAPYPMPDSSNPFAMGGGSAGMKGLLAMAGMIASVALTGPAVALALLAPPAVALVAALGWGAVVLGVGTYVAGTRLDLRGPEILVAVTPRR
jgi:ABC-2 type transport system permease protein